MEATFSLPVPVSVISSGRKADIDSLKLDISKFNRTHALFLAAKLNLITSSGRITNQESNRKAQGDALELLLSAGLINIKLLQKIENYRKRTFQKNKNLPMVFSRHGLLEFMRCISLWGSDDVNSETFLQYDHSQTAYFSALFGCSDIFLKRYKKYLPGTATGNVLSGKQLEEFRRKYQPMIRLMSDFAAPVREPLNYLGRARLLLVEEFFEKHVEYSEAFRGQHDGLAFNEYFACATAIMTTSLAKMKQVAQYASLLDAFSFKVDGMFPQSEKMREPFAKYLKFKSQTPTELSNAFSKIGYSDPTQLLNLKPIRQRPILRLERGIAIVLDEKLFAESVSVGPMFALLNGDRHHDWKVFADFGEACHRYAHRIIEYHHSLMPKELKLPVIVQEPEGVYSALSKQTRSLGDSAVIEGSSAALFETKGSWFNEKALKTVDSFWAEIYRLYGISEEDGVTKRRGFAQLADSVKFITSGEVIATGATAPLNKVEIIIPVLLAHDELAVQMSLPHLLALDFVREFNLDELPKNGTFTLGKHSIHSLVVLSFNDLESFQARKLDKSINHYLEEYSRWSPDRLRTFNEFFWEKYPMISRRSVKEQYLLRAATNTIDDVAVECFEQHLPD